MLRPRLSWRRGGTRDARASYAKAKLRPGRDGGDAGYLAELRLPLVCVIDTPGCPRSRRREPA